MKYLVLCSTLTYFLCVTSEIQDPKDWWKKGVFYQIYPRSFLDTNGNGVGDLKGIEEKLDYVKSLGVQATWLGPICNSPMKDFGYDVSNYISIDPLFGTMQDFDDYVAKSHKLGLKVIVDFVPNHSSDQHEWFNKSVHREDPYTDYYVWKDAKEMTPEGPKPPNNWISLFGGSAWKWSPIRKQFYYHKFLVEQPEINYKNLAVREEMKNIIRFWLDKGVDGLRIDAVPYLFEDDELRDEPPITLNTTLTPNDYDYYDHSLTVNLPEVLDVVAEWRDVFDEYEKRDGFHRLMMLETAIDFRLIIPYFGNDTHPLGDMPFNFAIMLSNKNLTGLDVYNAVWEWLKLVPENKWSNWLIGSHDLPRVSNRTHPDLVDAFNMINLLLRGTPLTYFGDELGMVDTYISWEQVQDPFGKWLGPENYTKFCRDPVRTPMQWDDSPFAGFTHGNTTWLPVNQNYNWLNVKNQEDNPRSHLTTYKKLVALKHELAIINGSIEFPFPNKEIFSFTRTQKGSPGYLILVNFSSGTCRVNLLSIKTAKFAFPARGTVVAMSDKIWPSVVDDLNVDMSFILMPPRQGIVIRFYPIWH